ncbi:MAG: trypsin-like peptidase domain-containing protein, partial [Clostridia bacterium]|nr:trypsin-like peptidase domain-containing protein [Clostridia bacterium]
MKKLSRILSFALIICVLATFTGCSLLNPQSISPYEIAKKNGFTGSESEWLDSLKGDSAYDLWLKAGNTGTLDDFFASLGNTVNNYDVTIEGETTTTEATSKGLLSVVSVYSTFTTTVYVREGFTYKEVPYDYSSAGSGVIYQLDKENGNAYVITNYHVIYDKDNESTTSGVSADVKLYLYGMQEEKYAIPATYVGGSKYYDIAVLQIQGSSVLAQSQAKAVSVADSNEISVGETAIAVGNPEALGISATAGIVCVDSEYITMNTADGTAQVSMRVMRVDTAINSGNSGGALYNEKGELIGITNAKIVAQGTENIAYAI